MASKGLYANIHAKRERIEQQKAAGKTPERMRKPGSEGAPTAKAFKQSAKTANSTQHAGAQSAFGQGFDGFDQAVTSFNVYACVFVG